MLEWQGRPDGTYTIRKMEQASLGDGNADFGTQVILTAKPGREDYFTEKVIRRLLTYYGLLLPFPIVVRTAGAEQQINPAYLPWDGRETNRQELYHPEELKRAYDKMEHGKARVAAIRSAIEAADAHEDTSFRIYFRLDLCEESCFYGDDMDMMVIFPEALVIVDRYPDTPTTCFDNNYRDEMDHILWVYKWVLNGCSSFYQVPLSDCLKFFEDFKRRSQAYGYNLRPYYYYLSGFYEEIDQEKYREAFLAFEKIPRDGNCDCKACERNSTIEFYLKDGQLEKARELAEDIENFVLKCGHDRKAAWTRLKTHYMLYYLRRRDFEEAEKYCRILERQTLADTEYQCWDDYLYCYAYRDMGKALRIYKAHWKEWQEERDPSEIFHSLL